MTESDTDKETQSESSQQMETADAEDEGSEGASEMEGGGLSLPGLDDLDGTDDEEESEAEASADGEEEDIFSLSVPSADEIDGDETSEEEAEEEETSGEESVEPAEASEEPEGDGEKQDESAAAEEADNSEPVSRPPRSDKPSKPPELPKRPDDVKGARETPDRKLNFRSGEKVGGRFTVQRYLGSSGGGISYLCKHDDAGGRVVIKVLAMPAPEGDQLEFIRQKIRTASQIRHKNLTNILGMGRTDDGKVYVAMDFVKIGRAHV